MPCNGEYKTIDKKYGGLGWNVDLLSVSAQMTSISLMTTTDMVSLSSATHTHITLGKSGHSAIF